MRTKESHTAYMREYRKRKPDYYAKHINHVRKWRKDNPEKYRAHVAVKSAVRNGTLTKPLNCSRCGEDKVLFAHHHDYAKPLDVIWICDNCHKEIHREAAHVVH